MISVSDVETRKLQAVGGGTVTVSLPKQWATDHDLDAGAEVTLYRHADESIVVRGPDADGAALKRVRIAVRDDSPERVRRTLRAAHAAGFETATLDAAGGSFTTEQRRAARRVADRLTGAAVETAVSGTIRLRALLDTAEVSIRQSVEQLRFLALSVHREGTAAALGGDPDGESSDRLAERAAAATRLSGTVDRHLERSLVSLGEVDDLGVSRPALLDCGVAARALDRVATHGVRLARAAGDEGVPETAADRVRTRAEAARDVVAAATDAVLRDGDADAAHDALDSAAEIERDAPADPRAGQAWECLAQTADAGETIARAALRADVRER